MVRGLSPAITSHGIDYRRCLQMHSGATRSTWPPQTCMRLPGLSWPSAPHADILKSEMWKALRTPSPGQPHWSHMCCFALMGSLMAIQVMHVLPSIWSASVPPGERIPVRPSGSIWIMGLSGARSPTNQRGCMPSHHPILTFAPPHEQRPSTLSLHMHPLIKERHVQGCQELLLIRSGNSVVRFYWPKPSPLCLCPSIKPAMTCAFTGSWNFPPGSQRSTMQCCSTLACT